MDGIGSVSGMVAGLQQSIDSALKKIQSEAALNDPAPENVERFEQNVRKSSINATPFATNMGTLVQDKSRLNAFSILGKNDPVDFYKFTVSSAGEVALGRVGDAGVRVQLMDKGGKVLADSNEKAGDAFEAYKKLAGGNMVLDRGDYTIRVTREPGVPAGQEKQYALQLRQGTFTQDYDTFAKQPDPKGDVPSYVRALKQLLTGGTNPTTSRIGLLLGGPAAAGRTRGGMFDGLF
ncbi:hypothetical protein [Azospirillum halopraeferens]|uniref:hypothetical protein n=1 Tax=Azospirillum halopraeferens TaxID=34010 RepID=UPI00048CDF9A|nr:hypothetical protein [Azospirillum halopraeferens]